jgi:hypothetical protein
MTERCLNLAGRARQMLLEQSQVRKPATALLQRGQYRSRYRAINYSLRKTRTKRWSIPDYGTSSDDRDETLEICNRSSTTVFASAFGDSR